MNQIKEEYALIELPFNGIDELNIIKKSINKQDLFDHMESMAISIWSRPQYIIITLYHLSKNK